MQHTDNYSPYGLGFAKPRIFAAGGAPVYYVRPEHFEAQSKKGWHPKFYPFITPFWPSYAPKNDGKEEYWKKYPSGLDYSHEREWRTAHDFSFEYEQVEFVVLPDYETMAKFPSDLKDAIGRDKFVLRETYRTIERLWPKSSVR